jgi:hypothetical protein
VEDLNLLSKVVVLLVDNLTDPSGENYNSCLTIQEEAIHVKAVGFIALVGGLLLFIALFSYFHLCHNRNLGSSMSVTITHKEYTTPNL